MIFLSIMKWPKIVSHYSAHLLKTINSGHQLLLKKFKWRKSCKMSLWIVEINLQLQLVVEERKFKWSVSTPITVKEKSPKSSLKFFRIKATISPIDLKSPQAFLWWIKPCSKELPLFLFSSKQKLWILFLPEVLSRRKRP